MTLRKSSLEPVPYDVLSRGCACVAGGVERIPGSHDPPVPREAGHMAWAGHLEGIHSPALRGSIWLPIWVRLEPGLMLEQECLD